MKDEKIEEVGGGFSQSQNIANPHGRERVRNADEVDPLYEPRPCRFCGVTVPYPEVVCERQKCRDKLEREHELDARIRNRMDLQRGE